MKKYKIIISFVFCFTLLLLSNSLAVPDFYYYDNFTAGMSPYSVPTSLDLDNSGYWEDYSPIQDWLGFVTSYDNISMSGATPVSAVPAYDMDIYIGKMCYIPAGQAVVVYSGSGQMADNRIITMSNSSMFALPLGTTSPTNFSLTASNNGQYYGSNAFYSDTNSTLLEVPYNWTKTNLSDEIYMLGIDSSVINQLPMSHEGYSPYQYSNVYLVVNYGNSDGYVYWNGYAGSRYNFTGIPYNDISWDVVTSNTYVNTNSNVSKSGNYIYAVPHINGDFDLYSYVHSNTETSEYYTYLSNYDINLDFDFSSFTAKNNYAGFFPITMNAIGSSFSRRVFMTSELTNLPASSGLVPIFIHQYNATRYIDGKAIYIYDGYINVQNYEELVALLKENGYSGDLARVIQLLDEINTGGDTGAAAKELMNILENYHQQIQNNANFGNSTGVFDTYKNILEFTEDMHWLVTANNALFEYFAGFIMLCAMFLFLGRVMR